MAIVSVTIPDQVATLLTATHGDLPTWFQQSAIAAARQARERAARRRLPELMKNEAFLNELAPLIRKHTPPPT